MNRPTDPPAAPRRRPWGALALIAVVAALALATVWPMVAEAARRLFGPPPLELREAYAPGDPTRIFDHSAFTAILRDVVDADGFVDYRALADDPRPLDAYLTRLATADFDALGRDEKLALLINAYNAIVLRTVVDRGTSGAAADAAAAGARRWMVGGRIVGLDELERDWLRARFREPRVHFAINPGTAGAAPLRREAYVGARLEEQLADQMRRVHGDPRFFDLRPDAGVLRLTQIYVAHAGDFQQVAGSLLAFVRRWSPELDRWCAEHGTPRVLWIGGDPRSNDVARRPG